MKVSVKSPQDIENMRIAGRLAAEVLQMIAPHVKPGVTTAELDRICHEHIVQVQQSIPANVGYKGFPASICTSVNNVICHGIPSPGKVLKDGDILNIDVTVIKDGWHGDTNRTYLVGEVNIKARRLVETTYEAMMLGIAQAKPGNHLGDVAHAIQVHSEKQRYGVVRDFCGHGIGRLFHDAPEVVHVGRPGTGPELKPGMFFTIEPMVNIGRPDCKVLEDGWTAVTRDRTLSAQFEHTIGITDTGCEIFTKSLSGLDLPHSPA